MKTMFLAALCLPIISIASYGQPRTVDPSYKEYVGKYIFDGDSPVDEIDISIEDPALVVGNNTLLMDRSYALKKTGTDRFEVNAAGAAFMAFKRDSKSLLAKEDSISQLKMKQSGISNWQVLQAATVHPAHIFGKEKETGSIALGKTADLVLLKANPIDRLQNLSRISLVINKGFVVYPDTLMKETPEELVQRQLNAYNARNIEAFLDTYADEVELYEHPSGALLSKGKEAMHKNYAAFFEQATDLHCEIKGRIVLGNVVIDKESVTAGGRLMEAVAIYHVEDGEIAKVYFVR